MLTAKSLEIISETFFKEFFVGKISLIKMPLNINIVKSDSSCSTKNASKCGFDCYTATPFFVTGRDANSLHFKIALPARTWVLLKVRSSKGCQGAFVVDGVC